MENLVEYGSCEYLVPREKKWYEGWKNKEQTRAIHKTGRYNGITVVLCCKDKNSGKKYSLILGEELVYATHKRCGRGRAGFIYHTDGDTVADENCLAELLKYLHSDKDLDGVSGILRAYQKEGASIAERGFAVMQDFQCFYSLIGRRITESLLNSTACLPGCASMIRMNDRTEAVMEKYRRLPVHSSSLLQAVTRRQGTDRRYTMLLLKQGSNLQMKWRAFVHTEPPLNPASSVGQRRRWPSNSLFNSIVLLYSRNIPAYIKFSAFIDVCRSFSTPFRFISYVFSWLLFYKLGSTERFLTSIVVLFPYVYSLVWVFAIVPEKGAMLVDFLLNNIFMPFLSVLLVSKMYVTSTNFDWGVQKAQHPARIQDQSVC